MSIRLLLILGLTSFLFGCSSDKVKEDAIVAVEDLSSEQDKSNAADSDAADSDAQTYGTEDTSTSKFSQLNDPQSPLSVRVIYFEYDSSEIRSEYRSVIENHSEYLSENVGTTVTLEGHADELGSREYNLALGERRAKSIKQQMMLLGVSSSQVRLVSYGEERPEVDGHDEVSWQKNRRVEILY
ncbi:peptidoglycan-associated lipoprotein Pal [Gammaproteobacteria bacterium]|nr:peptidoglycan-associated lipoprotein Pal [Gammaproteobacteria bacterium]